MTDPEDHGRSRVLVTGASRGIGRAIALGMADAGFDVIGVARTASALDEVGGKVEASGGRFKALPADLYDPTGIEDIVAAAWDWQGGVEGLVNTAGTIVRTPTLEIVADEWDEVFALNVRATFFVTQALARRMLEAGGGSVVNIASLAAGTVTGASVSYAATKAAVVQMTKVLAVRFAPKIRVNAVGPGYIRTDLNKAWLEDATNHAYVMDHTPLDRVGVPEDVVGAVVFLMSPAASFITGQHLLVDGGWSTG